MKEKKDASRERRDEKMKDQKTMMNKSDIKIEKATKAIN